MKSVIFLIPNKLLFIFVDIIILIDFYLIQNEDY